jgi:hypothetical protein
VSTQNKREFEVEKDGVELQLVAVRPDQKTRQEADLEYAKAWGRYAKDPDILLETTLWDAVRKRGLWDDAKQKQLEEIDRRLEDGEATLPDANGRVRKKGVKLSAARRAAIDMRVARVERVRLLGDFTRLKSLTAEGLANQDRFNFLASRCVKVADTGKAYFKDVEDYKARGGDPDTLKAAEEFANLYFGYDPDADERNLVENQFLLKHRMIRDKDLALVDREGRLCDVEGNPVGEDGNPLPEEGQGGEAETFEVEDDWGAGA